MDKFSQQVIDLIQKWDYDEDKFNTDQLTELYLGLKNGLSEEQIFAYTSKSLSADKMMVCRQYGENGFDSYKIYLIRLGFENGLTEDQIKLYANPEYNWRQMERIKKRIEMYNVVVKHFCNTCG